MMPFKMRQETAFEKWRAETFWDKEPETIAWIQAFDSADAFIDVGANIGIYSLYTASLYPEISIFALEPAIYNYAALTHNVELNNFENIRAWDVGIGLKIGKSRFHDSDCEAGATGGHIGEVGYEITVMDLESLIMWHHNHDFYNIKIDTDAGELEIMQSVGSAWERVRSLLVEINSDKDQITEMMELNGFTADNKFNSMSPHSRERRHREGITAENIIFTRR